MEKALVKPQTSTASPTARWPSLQRKCACGGTPGPTGECENCRRKRLGLQRKGVGPQPTEVPPIVHEVLRSPGQPLEPTVRAALEPRFGHDFSRVRVHTGSRAAESARAVNALAYTLGRDVVFAAGQYAPATAKGQKLLAHELTHVLQQGGSSSPLQAQPADASPLTLGPAHDPSEAQAEDVAQRIASGGTLAPGMILRAPSHLQRAPDAPEPLRTDTAHLPAPSSGADARIHVIRKLMPCECRKVPDVREGVFWNPDLDAFAIAYRHCRGGTTTDIYTEVESNLSSFLTGGAPPVGTARIGFEINVVGRRVSGRGTLEVLGSNIPGGEGIGGRAQVVFQGDRWRVFLTSDFLHRLGATPGDVLNLNLGAQLGPISVEVQVSDALSPTPIGSGAGCVDIFGSSRLCFTLSAGGGTGVTGGIELRLPLGGPEVRREECFQCLCPPPTKQFECYLDIPPTEREVSREISVEVPGEYRYYFRLNRTTPSEDADLRARSSASLDAVARDVAAGGQVVTLFGYASPEATEAHNTTLSAERAEALAGLLRARLPSGTPLPTPSGGGELLGRRPSPAPSSRLGEAIRAGGFRSAEDISIFLLGEEIPHAELSEQFVSLFRALPEPNDRLALFGLGPDDPLAPRVLATVEEFLRSPRRGSRPWERVFRLLRVGVVRTSRPERRAITETERTPGSLTALSASDCRERGLEAERGGLLPPIPQELRLPRRGREDREVECTIEVRPEDRRSGCSYELTPDMRKHPTAPARAPRRFP